MEKKRILIADDDELMRTALTVSLAPCNYDIDVVENGYEAIIQMELRSYDLIISDYKMPGPDGLETLSRIARLNPEITRILLTGYATMESAIRATNEGLDGFLTKPFDNIELRSKIREIIIRKRCKISSIYITNFPTKKASVNILIRR